MKQIIGWVILALTYFGLMWALPYFLTDKNVKEALKFTGFVHATVIGALLITFVVRWCFS